MLKKTLSANPSNVVILNGIAMACGWVVACLASGKKETTQTSKSSKEAVEVYDNKRKKCICNNVN